MSIAVLSTTDVATLIFGIELVFVRYGGDDSIYETKRSESRPTLTQVSSSALIPIFLYLEVCNAKALSKQHARNSRGFSGEERDLE